MPKMYIGRHEEAQFKKTWDGLPHVVDGFLIKDKEDKMTLEMGKPELD